MFDMVTSKLFRKTWLHVEVMQKSIFAENICHPDLSLSSFLSFYISDGKGGSLNQRKIRVLHLSDPARGLFLIKISKISKFRPLGRNYEVLTKLG